MWVGGVVILVCASLATSACGNSSTATEPPAAVQPANGEQAASGQTPATDRAALVARGEYLVEIAACHDCHTPKRDVQTMEFDRSRLLTGRPATTAPPAEPSNPGEISASPDLTAWWGPWGVSYAANLTPDRETGLGARYTEATFIAAIRTGKKPEGEPLLPPMPWPAYRHMTDDDLRAIYAFLQTIPPVNNFVRNAAPRTSP